MVTVSDCARYHPQNASFPPPNLSERWKAWKVSLTSNSSMKMPREDDNNQSTSIQQSKVPKLHQHRHQIACWMSKNIYNTQKPQLHITCRCSSFLNTCHLSTRLCRWSQAVTKTCSNQRRKELSIHAPTMGNGCVVAYCHRSWSKILSNIL